MRSVSAFAVGQSVDFRVGRWQLKNHRLIKQNEMKKKMIGETQARHFPGEYVMLLNVICTTEW